VRARVVSEVSQEDQQKIDQFMQNQQLRGRRRMPVRPLADVRPPLRLIRPSAARSAGVPPRPLFRPRISGRVPFGFGSSVFGNSGFGNNGFGGSGFGTGRFGNSRFGSSGFGSGAGGFGRGNFMPAGGMPPRRKILVNPHFRGSSSMTMVQGPPPSASPAASYPKLIRDEAPRQPQQQPQFTVYFVKL